MTDITLKPTEGAIVFHEDGEHTVYLPRVDEDNDDDAPVSEATEAAVLCALMLNDDRLKAIVRIKMAIAVTRMEVKH